MCKILTLINRLKSGLCWAGLIHHPVDEAQRQGQCPRVSSLLTSQPSGFSSLKHSWSLIPPSLCMRGILEGGQAAVPSVRACRPPALKRPSHASNS